MISAILNSVSAAFPRSQAFGKTFFGTPGRGKRLALTYDDGPNDPHTLKLLDVLAHHQVKATFFLIGRFVEQRPDIVQRIAAEGHAIGNHTYSHPSLPRLTLRQVAEELIQCEMALLTFGGIQRGDAQVVAQDDVRPVAVEEELKTNLRALRQATGTRLFRPPYGARSRRIVDLARGAGYEVVQWSAMGWDWHKTGADRVARYVERGRFFYRGVTGGDVVLLHDGGDKAMGQDRAHTVEATEKLISRYKAEGYEFVTVEEMMGIR